MKTLWLWLLFLGLAADDRQPVRLLPGGGLSAAILPIIGSATRAPGGGHDLGGGEISKALGKGHFAEYHQKTLSAMPKISLAIIGNADSVSTMKTFRPMLAQEYQGQPVDGWLMSEKLDGVRAIWDGEMLRSRNGNQFMAPAWFLAQLPSGVVLDGELFMGRGRFQATVSVVRKKVPVDAEWQGMRFCVFDAPAAAGGFEDRLAFCESAVIGSTVAEVVPHRPCLGRDDLASFFVDLCGQGAEGVMFRQPGSLYENRRSGSLLKYKPSHSAEAIMVGSELGAGRLAGVVGALVLQWGDVVFRVGTGLSDELRRNPPVIGAAITFGFCGLTDAGVPRFPTFQAERSYE